MQRRSFIKGACRICLLGAAGAAIASDLSSCSPALAKTTFKPVVKNDQVEVPLSLFKSQAFHVISPEKYEFEISVEKKPDNTYMALLLKCTHYNNQLTTTGSGFFCSLHGSKFDKNGDVQRGPADQPLEQLKTQIVDNNLLIHL
ncbi:MAG: Rieske 2Fe-2S domain-containing protein [Ferruginibacter sp.]